MNFKKLDALFLSKFQIFSDWVQNYFGINNFFIAKITYATTITCYFIMIIFYYLAGIDVLGYFYIFSSIFFIFIPWVFVYQAEKMNASYPAYKNFLEEYLFHERVFLTVMILLTLLSFPAEIHSLFDPSHVSKEQYKNLKGLFFDLAWIFIFMFVYFGSCTPKPPTKSKIKKLKEEISEKINSIAQTPLKPNFLSETN